jgi:small subunit ribosomal protein S9
MPVTKKPRTTTVKKAVKAAVKPAVKSGHYFEATGRRKTAVANVRLHPGTQKESEVNNMSFDKYFSSPELKQMAFSALEKMDCLDKFKLTARVNGGGINGQAEAIRQGTSQALIKFNADFRARLKSFGFLTRDSRMRERKKFGLKRARRAPQWTKR